MKAFAKASPVKTDRKDAHLIALAMKADLYRAVHVKTDESQRLRFLLTARELLMRQVPQLEGSRAKREGRFYPASRMSYSRLAGAAPALPDLDTRSANELLGYDANGLPH
jgi:hypothetical protein